VTQSTGADVGIGAEVGPQKGGIFSRHPVGFWFFFWGELAERSSYYGMRAILALYMTNKLGFTDSQAGVWMSYFIAGCYFLPLVGGYLADNYFGKYRTIVGFSIPYILGHVILGIESKTFLLIALVLLAMGSGVIKPNISTLMGMTYDQQRPGEEKLRSDAFAMFYWAINIGAALSSFAMPMIRTRWGYAVAFLFPAALMAIAFAIFAAGKRHYAVEVISKKTPSPEEKALRRVVLGRIFGLFLVVTFFWSIFDQAASTWTFFARDYLDLNLFGHEMEPDAIQGFNPILIILLLPPVNLLWKFLANRGLELRATDKMMVGFVLTAVCMAVMSAAGYMATPQHKVTVLWEILAYVIITVAEICISVSGLELAFTAAPKAMKSFVTACWLLTVFFGNIFNAQITQFYGKEKNQLLPGPYFGLLALMMIPVSLAFFFIARRFNREAARWDVEQVTGETAPA
jgi:proton-dependent oligopeptide transporter, POT family